VTLARPRGVLAVAVIAAAGILASACSSGNSSAKPSAPATGSSAAADAKPEKSQITVGTLPIADAADLFIAIHKGFFRSVGLTVKPEILQATALATPGLLSGKLDFSLLNYVSTFEIEQNGGIKFAYVAPGTQAAPNVSEILVPKGSSITSVADLKGKKIGTPQTRGAIGNLAMAATLKAHGINPSQVTFVAIPFPDEQAALARGEVDAVWATEPFVTAAKFGIGARALADTMTGVMAGFPVGGWGTLQQYAQKYPHTVAAFQKAMAAAQQVASSDHALVQQTLPTYTTIKPKVASSMAFDTFTPALDTTQLQQAANLMLTYSFLHAKLNVAPMILPAPSG
jgi:NitT/TauT family transport system substrate-binding protein